MNVKKIWWENEVTILILECFLDSQYNLTLVLNYCLLKVLTANSSIIGRLFLTETSSEDVCEKRGMGSGLELDRNGLKLKANIKINLSGKIRKFRNT